MVCQADVAAQGSALLHLNLVLIQPLMHRFAKYSIRLLGFTAIVLEFRLLRPVITVISFRLSDIRVQPFERSFEI